MSAELNVVTVDLRTSIAWNGQIDVFDDPCLSIGLHHNTRPTIREIPLQEHLVVVAYTDGLTHAGSRYDQPMQVLQVFDTLLTQGDISSQKIADGLLQHAVDLDQGCPADDITVAVLLVLPGNDSDNVRRMTAKLPID